MDRFKTAAEAEEFHNEITKFQNKMWRDLASDYSTKAIAATGDADKIKQLRSTYAKRAVEEALAFSRKHNIPLTKLRNYKTSSLNILAKQEKGLASFIELAAKHGVDSKNDDFMDLLSKVDYDALLDSTAKTKIRAAVEKVGPKGMRALKVVAFVGGTAVVLNITADAAEGKWAKAGGQAAYEVAGLYPPIALAQMVGEGGYLAGETITTSTGIDEAGAGATAIFVNLNNGTVLDRSAATAHIRSTALAMKTGGAVPASPLAALMDRWMEKNPDRALKFLEDYHGKYGAFNLDHVNQFMKWPF